MFLCLTGEHTTLDTIHIMQISFSLWLTQKNGQGDMMKGVMVGLKVLLLKEMLTSEAKSEIDIETGKIQGI